MGIPISNYKFYSELYATNIRNIGSHLRNATEVVGNAYNVLFICPTLHVKGFYWLWGTWLMLDESFLFGFIESNQEIRKKYSRQQISIIIFVLLALRSVKTAIWLLLLQTYFSHIRPWKEIIRPLPPPSKKKKRKKERIASWSFV